jgi:hypothetical protein
MGTFVQKVEAALRGFVDEARASAFRRSQALTKLSELQLPVSEHLFKIAHYPRHPAFEGWVRELRAWSAQLRRLHRAKKRSGNYNLVLLMRSLWEEPLGSSEDRMEIAAQLEAAGFVKVEIDAEKLKTAVQQFAEAVLNPTAGHMYTP